MRCTLPRDGRGGQRFGRGVAVGVAPGQHQMGRWVEAQHRSSSVAFEYAAGGVGGSPRPGDAESRLLFVTRRPPWPLNGGGRIRSFRLLEGLSRSFDTTLLTLAHNAGSPDGSVDLDELAAALPGVGIVTEPGLGAQKRLAQLRGLVGRRSWHYGRYALDHLGRRIERLVEERSIDLVHADDLGTALVVASHIDATVVYSSHNVEYRIVAGDRKAGVSALRRAFAGLETIRVRREERSVWSRVDLTLACSGRFDSTHNLE